MGKQRQQLVIGGKLHQINKASQVKMCLIWGLSLLVPFLVLFCIFPSGTIPYHRIVVSQVQGPSLRAIPNDDGIHHREIEEKPSTSSLGEPDVDKELGEQTMIHSKKSSRKGKIKHHRDEISDTAIDEKISTSVRKPLGKEINANEEDPIRHRSSRSKPSTRKPGSKISSLGKEISATEGGAISPRSTRKEMGENFVKSEDSIAAAEEGVPFPTKEKTSKQRLGKERFPKSAKMASNPPAIQANDTLADILFWEDADKEMSLIESTTTKKKKKKREQSFSVEEKMGEDDVLDDLLEQQHSHDGDQSGGQVIAEKCRYYKGRWIIDSKDPLYMDSTCSWMSMNDDQNCEVINKSTNPMKWRWQPADCNMERFKMKSFLKLMRRKSLAFVGDSLAKAQMQSLVCLLAQVEKPSLVYDNKDNHSMSWHFDSSKITISMVWSPYLVQDVDENGYKKLRLDKLDTKWAVMVPTLDVLVLGVGSLFIEPTIYTVKDEVVGCYACKDLHAQNNITELSMYSGFRATMRSTIMGVGALPGFQGITLFLQPFGFEGNGSFHSVSMKMKNIQEDELYQAYKRGSISNQSKMEVLHTDLVSMTGQHDPMQGPKNPRCLVHSPLTDTWNQFLQHTLIRLLNHASYT